ncbi:MAG: alpha/beta hydrolase [Chloroflexi bacterium]|nr:alpha/beta hydrolase [Chloroflexota bacterium]
MDTAGETPFSPENYFIHRWIPSQDGQGVLLVLHGTGGDENDLIPLARAVAPGAALLSLRGRVSENGMPRFFRRLAEGVFDEPDLRRQAADMAAFLRQAAQVYAFSPDSLYALGYSNGANIASAVMLLHPGVIHGALLFRSMVPLELDSLPDLSGTPVWMSSGRRDPIVPLQNAERLAQMFRQAGVQVRHLWQPGGHELAPGEIQAAADWWKENR